ncbi:LOW QUALITY PROTEIN: tRNA (cytosine(38)-C(5))-methyltransferase [Drosophila obscura]|uniref:LOW QUALITY PROTEIN: tRNA (cytosine(38)-C(5))-methyltransferase n=1 Tax=Drosophila obscura TaxID=7282 RepID=UPI001BB1F363|nr:LOW QUALITY PROTEIN: tRNA (cytosine(38)-C(5))-methyltransferase [Drosophila obscura]
MGLRVLELFSGIGGMHYAFKYAQLEGEIVAALDVNTVANAVYAHNYGSTHVKTRNIQSLSEKEIRKLGANVLLMSPPCQPHTRQGLQRDTEDKRSDALTHLCTLIPQCESLQYVLMENVKGFERSQARNHFVEALEKAGFYWREFILTPTQFNVPNTRHRYYCIARKTEDFGFAGGKIWDEMPDRKAAADQSVSQISAILEDNVSCEHLVPDDVLAKRVLVMDIIHPTQNRSMCFTKGYTHYTEGTGSAFTPLSEEESHRIFEQVKEIDDNNRPTCSSSEDVRLRRLDLLRQIKLRYFTPREVARLMSFPEEFGFPPETTNRQKYRLLGNSINVKVVGELIKLLTTTKH